jgi:hypothetical protein
VGSTARTRLWLGCAGGRILAGRVRVWRPTRRASRGAGALQRARSLRLYTVAGWLGGRPGTITDLAFPGGQPQQWYLTDRVGHDDLAVSAAIADLRFQAAFVLVDQSSQYRSASDPVVVTVRGGVRVIVARRDTFQCSVRSAAAVVGAVLAENGPQVSFTEDQDAVGEFGSDGQDVAFDEAVRSRTSRPNLHGLYACVGRDCVERGGELARSVADEDPEDRCGRRSPSAGCGLVVWSRLRSGGWRSRGCARSGCGPRGRRRRRFVSR